ncbi:hypothetical protein GCM10010182_67850 [Actinomadura cremea]|nr:hypothetical protein GCM10010182_67850 [Actinomadura cremea]
MRILAALAGLLLAIVLTGCGGSDPEPAAVQDSPHSGGQQPSAPVRLRWDQPGTVGGTNGQKLRVTPIGILYDGGSADGGEPANGVFVVLALRAEAVGQADTVAAPMTGGGFMWQGPNAQKITSGDGNAVTTAWVGEVNEFSNVPIQPGEPEVGIETFDIPAKGGRLIYVDPATTAVTSWELPTADQGEGLDKVRQRIKLFA